MGQTVQDQEFAIVRESDLPFEQALAQARAQLKEQGFGVLCEIDVAATLREKLGLEREPYVILGACNPNLAHQALDHEVDLGVLLPCNVVVYRQEGRTHVAAVDAERMLSIVNNPQLSPIAAEVRRRLAEVVERAVA